MPEGVPFQKPNVYGANQIRKIMQCKDAIKFVINNREAILTKGSKKPGISDLIDISPQQREVLAKIIDVNILQERKAMESDIDVTVDLSSLHWRKQYWNLHLNFSTMMANY